MSRLSLRTIPRLSARLNNDLQRRTLLLAGIGIVGVLVTLFLAAYLSFHNTQSDIERHAQAAMEVFDQAYLTARSDLYSTGAAMLEWDDVDEELLQFQLRNPAVLDVYVVQPDGSVRTQRSAPGRTKNKHIDLSGWVQAPMTDDALLESPLRFDRQSPYVEMAARIRGKGDLTGMLLVAHLDLNAMWASPMRGQSGMKGYMYVVDERGLVVARQDAAGVDFDREIRPVIGGLPNQNPGLGFMAYLGKTGLPVLADSEKSEYLPLYVIVEQPVSEAAAHMWLPVLSALTILALVTWLMASTVKMARARVILPLIEMRDVVMKMSAGDLSQRVNYPRNDEIGQLAGAFNSMAEELDAMFETLDRRILQLRRTQHALQDAHQFNDDIIRGAGEGIAVYDRDLKYQYWNPYIERLTGMPSADVLGKCALDLFPHLTEQGVDKILRRALDGEEPQKVEYPYRFPKNGREGWMSATYVPHRNHKGSVVGVIATLHDITTRKEAVDRVERQIRQLSTLRAIDRHITTKQPLEGILDFILDQALSQLGADAADILLYHPHSDSLAFGRGKGFSTALIEKTLLPFSVDRNPPADAHTHDPIEHRKAVLQAEGLSVCHNLLLKVNEEVLGILEVYFKVDEEKDQEWWDFYEALAGQAAIAIEDARMFESLSSSNRVLRQAYEETIEGWSRALDLRDHETEGHSRRVTEATLTLAKAMGIPQEQLEAIRRGALLHDIGKVGVPDSILLKPGPLDDEEWAVMKQHPRYAYELLAPIQFLGPAIDIPHYHHEKWDGSGYPHNLAGETIPLAARLFAVVDVWDALSSDRPYRPGWEQARVLEYIRGQSGVHFDPAVVEVFLDLVERGEIDYSRL